MGEGAYKQCRDCKEWKDVDNDFYRPWKNLKSGTRRVVFSYCKACVAKRNTAWIRKNPDKLHARKHRYYVRDGRDSRLRREFGITESDYTALLASQRHCCAICGGVQQAMRSRKTGGHFHVDHDHVTGKVRGLLCFLCNAGMGMFKDDASRLRAAVAYLERA